MPKPRPAGNPGCRCWLAGPAKTREKRGMLLWLRFVILLLGCFAAARAQAGADVACAPRGFDGAAFMICRVSLPEADLRLFHHDEQGRLFGQFPALADHLAGRGKHLVFAMNAGMYHEDRAPVGLHVEHGATLAPLVTGDGPGNFHLKPNGVFFVREDGTAEILDTETYQARGPSPRFATQSGPMLVIDGALHPAIRADATSRKMRNGVGISADGRRAWFAITMLPVNFDTFARLFRDELATPNALFLDGGMASKIHAPALGLTGEGVEMGPIIGVVGERP